MRGIVNGYLSGTQVTCNPSTKSLKQKQRNQKWCYQQKSLIILHLKSENVELTNVFSELGDKIDQHEEENEKLKELNGDLKQKVNLNFLFAEPKSVWKEREC